MSGLELECSRGGGGGRQVHRNEMCHEGVDADKSSVPNYMLVNDAGVVLGEQTPAHAPEEHC